jgi:ATP-dependent RNA/DNA helicase IGHMBP2
VSSKAIEGLLKLQELLAIEQDEDYRQYYEKFISSSLYERRENGLTWYPVVIKGNEKGLGGYLVLEIERTPDASGEPHQMQPGKNAELFSNNSEYAGQVINGVIKSLNKNTIKLSLTTDDLPHWVKEGKLGVNILFDENTYREMDLALKKVMSAKDDRLAELREIFYGEKQPYFDKENLDVFFTELNESQNDALRKIDAARDVAIVHGPPGTGKTTTLVRAIKHTLKTESQILICSPSNIAVDLVTEKLAEQGINVLRLGNPVRVSENLLKNTLDARVLNHPMYKELKQFRRKAAEYKQMAGKYKRNFGKAERDQRNKMYAEARSISREADDLESYLVDDQLSKAQVIACTPVVAAGRLIRDKVFDTVFIDEAAQALEPATWIPIIRAKRVVLAGDHFQLPPTVKSKKAEEGGFGATLFEKIIQNHPDAATMLKTQYRMNQLIMGFSNQKFYENKLIAHDSVSVRTLIPDSVDAILSEPVEFIDTAGCGHQEEMNPETLSYYNSGEAQILLSHLHMLFEKYYSLCDVPVSVGIISPYREQIQLINELISADEELKKFLPLITIKTVDGFQGQERDIIYINMVRSNESGDIGFLSDIRRMNVAITRAKKKLVVIGDSATLSHHPFYDEFLQYQENIKSYKSAWEFLQH